MYSTLPPVPDMKLWGFIFVLWKIHKQHWKAFLHIRRCYTSTRDKNSAWIYSNLVCSSQASFDLPSIMSMWNLYHFWFIFHEKNKRKQRVNIGSSTLFMPLLRHHYLNSIYQTEFTIVSDTFHLFYWTALSFRLSTFCCSFITGN